jgi:tape measure domain-containing protein
MTDFATLVLAADTRQMTGAEKSIDRVTAAGAKAEKGMDRLERETREASVATKGLAASGSTATTVLRRLGAAAAAAFGTQSILNAAESYTKMDNSLRALGLSAGEAQARLNEVAGIATRTRAPLESTLQLYSRLSLAAGDLGASNKQLSEFTETVGMSLSAAGIGANEASGALLQLSQALSGGIVRAEEFNSIVEGAFPLARLAAQGIDEAGGSVSRLRNLVLDGKISSQEFFNAILAGSDQAKKSFGDTEVTIGQALTALRNSFTLLVGGIDEATGATAAIAGALVFASENLDVVGIAIAGLVGSQIPAMITGIGTLTVAMRGLAVASWAAAGPWGLLAGLAAAAGAAFVTFKRDIDDTQVTIDEVKAAQDAANTQLVLFSTTYAPAAGKAAIDTANDYLQLAKAAREAAAGQLANMTAEASRIQGMIDNGHLRNLTIEEQAIMSGRLHGAQSRLTIAEEAYNRALEARDRTVDKVIKNDARMADATSDVNSQINVTVTSADGAADAVKNLNDALNNATSGAGKTKEQIQSLNAETEKAPQIVDDLANAWGNFVGSGFKDFDGFIKAVGNSFKNMIASLAADWARSGLMKMLGIGGAGAGVGGLIGSGGGSGLMGGLQGVLSGGGLGSSFSNLGGLMTGSVGGWGAVGAALPAAGIIFGAVMALGQARANKFKQSMQAALDKVEAEAARKTELMTQRLQANAVAIDDLNKSLETLAQLESEREAAALAILGERQNLEVELLRLQNDLVALREREINALEPVNRQLARFVYAMRDAGEAIEEQRRALSTLANAGGDIVDFVRSLRGAPGSSFAQDLALAQSGDVAASQRLPSSAQAAINAFKATATTGVQVDRFIAQTAASLLALPAVVTYEEQQIMLLDEISEGVTDLTALQANTQRELINAIESGFFVIDKNLDGKLTFSELKDALGGIATDSELRQIFDLLDVNGSGTLDKLEAVEGSTANTDANTLESWLAAQNQISELKIIAGETANNTQRVSDLTDAIENLIFGQKLAAGAQLDSLQQQRAEAAAALQSAQNQLSGTQSYIEGPRLYGFFGPRISSPNPAYVALEADIRRLKQELDAIDAQIGNVPQFADGGVHMGGVRMVGERGPELEVTGPSRIYNSGDTMAMLSNAPVVAELRELRREVAGLRDEQRQLGIQTSRNTDRTYRVLREWDVVGLPQERT